MLTLQVLASSSLPQQIIHFPLNFLSRFDQTAKEFTQSHESVRNPRKIANKLKTGASGVVNANLFVT